MSRISRARGPSQAPCPRDASRPLAGFAQAVFVDTCLPELAYIGDLLALVRRSHSSLHSAAEYSLRFFAIAERLGSSQFDYAQ